MILVIEKKTINWLKKIADYFVVEKIISTFASTLLKRGD